MDYKNIAMSSKIDPMILETSVMLFFRNECNDEDVSLHPQTPYLSGVQKQGEGVDKILYLQKERIYFLLILKSIALGWLKLCFSSPKAML